MWRGLVRWVGLGGRLAVSISFFLILLGKQLVVERIFEYNRGMELGDPTATTREPRSRLDEALDTFEHSLAELITPSKPADLITSQLRRRSRCGNASKPSATGSRSSITG